jgi:hypothetical protein
MTEQQVLHLREVPGKGGDHASQVSGELVLPTTTTTTADWWRTCLGDVGAHMNWCARANEGGCRKACVGPALALEST